MHSEEYLLARLRSANAQWLELLDIAAFEGLAREALSQFDLTTCLCGPAWDRLDQDGYRLCVCQSESVAVTWANRIAQNSGSALRADVRRETGSDLTQARLVDLLIKLVPQVTSSLLSQSAPVRAPTPQLWRYLAHEVARLVSRMNRSTAQEWLILNHLVTAGYFIECRFLYAVDVRQHLETQSGAVMGLRGSAVRIVQHTSEQGGVTDCAPHIVPAPTAPICLKLAHLSDLLEATAQEATASLCGAGFIQQTLPVACPWLATHRAQLHFHLELLALASMSLSSVEFLLRCRAEQCGIEHIRTSGAPVSPADWYQRLGLSGTTIQHLVPLFDRRSGNLRNRYQHGGLLHYSARHREIVWAQSNPERLGPAPSPFGVENVFACAVAALVILDEELAGLGVCSVNTGWTSRLAFSPDDMGFCRQLPSDFRSEGEIQLLSNYLTSLFPAVKRQAQVGLFSHISAASPHRVAFLYLLVGVIETAMRGCVHLLGQQVLQIDGHGNFQYLMLDKRGLLSPAVLQALVSPQPLLHRQDAMRTMRLCASARNVLMHGAFTQSSSLAGPFAAVTAKALIVVLEKARDHLEQEAAYFQWLSSGGHGDPLQHWLLGELEIEQRFFSP